MRGFDCNQKLTYEKALQFRQQGKEFAIRYVGREQMASFDLDKQETSDILRAGLGLGVVQHVERAGWIPFGEKGLTYGKNAATFAKQAGYEEGCSLFLDLESVKPGTPKKDIFEYGNAWYDEVVKVYRPTLYVGCDTGLTGDDLYHGFKFQDYWASASKIPDVSERGYEMKQGLEISMFGIKIDPDEVTGDRKGNKPIFMMPEPAKQYEYYKVDLTHVVEIDPMALHAELVSGKRSTRQNWVNGNFFVSPSKIIGWLISEGKVLAERHEIGVPWAKPKGSLIVYKDGSVFAGPKMDADMVAEQGKIWFACQGFNLFPLNIRKEGFNPDEVGRATNRVSIGYNKAKNKVMLAVRPASDASRAVQTMKNLGCESAICLDSGSSCNLVVNGKALFKTDRPLNNILFW